MVCARGRIAMRRYDTVNGRCGHVICRTTPLRQFPSSRPRYLSVHDPMTIARMAWADQNETSPEGPRRPAAGDEPGLCEWGVRAFASFYRGPAGTGAPLPWAHTRFPIRCGDDYPGCRRCGWHQLHVSRGGSTRLVRWIGNGPSYRRTPHRRVPKLRAKTGLR